MYMLTPDYKYRQLHVYKIFKHRCGELNGLPMWDSML